MVVIVSTMVVMVVMVVSTMVTMVVMTSAAPTSGENTSGGGEQGDDGY